MMSRCIALRKDGQPCAATALQSSQYCLFHSPEHQHQVHHGRRQGGITVRRQRVLSADAADVMLQAAGDVTALLALTMSRLQRGEIEPKIATAIGYLSAVALNSLEQGKVVVPTKVEFIVNAPTEPLPVDR
jgi:hypothetical protein